MQLYLHCPNCSCRLSAPADLPTEDVVTLMTADAPWFALADGETFEDMVFTALQNRGRILCPNCREEVLVG